MNKRTIGKITTLVVFILGVLSIVIGISYLESPRSTLYFLGGLALVLIGAFALLGIAV